MVRGISGEATKNAIRETAINEFRLHGYRGTSLEDIATQLGITRAAVLHHYGTKADLLAAVLDPYLESLEEIVERYGPTAPLSLHKRRAFLADAIDAFIAHRDVAGILIRDVTALVDPHAVERAGDLLASFTVLLAGPEPTPSRRLITTAILGAVLRPLTDPTIDPNDDGHRATLIQVAYTLSKMIDAPSGKVDSVGVRKSSAAAAKPAVTEVPGRHGRHAR